MVLCLFAAHFWHDSSTVAVESPGSDRQTRQVSRLALLIGLIWLLGYGLLNGAVSVSEAQSLHHGLLLFLNSLWGSAYFLVNLGLMVRLWRGRSLKLPVLQRLMKYLP